MGRRRSRSRSSSDDVIKLVGLGVLFLALTGALESVLVGIAVVAAGVAGIGGLVYLFIRIKGRNSSQVLPGKRQVVKASTDIREERPNYRSEVFTLSQEFPKKVQVVQALPDIEVVCPNCNSELVAPDNMAGQQVKCEACQTVFSLPKPKQMISDAALVYSGPAKFYSNLSPVDVPAQLSLALLNQMDWKRFEQLTEGYFQKTGWLTQPNRTGADGGVDIHLFRPGEGGPAAVVQCKAWSAYMVGVKPVRELLGVMTSDKVPQGFFVTSDTYTDEALDFAEKNNITLISGCNLLRKIKELPPADQDALRELATEGDYLTPTCPSCGRKMVMRTAAKGSRVGNSFWGCPSYPRCKAHLNLKKA